MDIILEVVDHYFADWAYAALVPADSFSTSATISSSYELYNNGTEGISKGASWEYTPSTHLFYLEPTAAAYESIWDRDNICRQAISLFFITWYDFPSPTESFKLLANNGTPTIVIGGLTNKHPGSSA